MRNDQIVFVVTVNLKYSVCYNRETLLENILNQTNQLNMFAITVYSL